MRLTSITLKVTGANAQALVAGPLTSGMVGIPIIIEYDDAWEGLTKNLVCRCSKSGYADEEHRSILNVGNTAIVAHEVMQAGKHLYLGIEGYSTNGTLVIPTTWAMCGVIQRGANTGADLSADPTLPVWGQLQTDIEQIKQDTVTPELVAEIRGYAQAATKAATNAERSKDHAVAASNEALSNAAAARNAADMAQASSNDARTSASSAANLANGALQAQRSAEAAAERAEMADGGMTTAAKSALMAVVESIGVFTVDNPQALIDNLRNALYNAPVAAVSAVYTQSRTVYATDSLDVLRDDLVVTAAYTDGSSAVRTDYTLSGALSAGVSTITAALDGKTATFEVQVAAARIPATGITLSSTALSITAGDSVRLTATVEPANSTDTVVWASSEEAVATVAQDGTVTPVANGSCKIIATAGEVSAECAVSVSMPLVGYNYGNPYLNQVSGDPADLGKTDEELAGKFCNATFNKWSGLLNGGGITGFASILIYPMSGGTFWVRTVNRSSAPDNGFRVFGNGDIVSNPTKFLAFLPNAGGTDAATGVTVEKISSFDWTTADGTKKHGTCNIGPAPYPGGGTVNEAHVILYKVTAPDDVFAFFQAPAGAANNWPTSNADYPIDDLYTIFRDDPSGNILQIAREVQE